jgi:hypothetical protein
MKLIAFRQLGSGSGIWHVYDPQRERGLCKVEILGDNYEFMEARLVPKADRCRWCTWARGWPSYNPDVTLPEA